MSGATTADDRPPGRLAPPTPRVAVVIAAAIVVGVVLYLGRSALVPFVAGALLIYLLDPAVGLVARLRIGRWRVPRGLAVLIVYVITFVVVVEGLALLLGPLVAQLVDYVRDLPRLTAALEDALGRLSQIYRSLELPPTIREFIDGLIGGLLGGAGEIDFGTLLPLARAILGTAAGFFGFLIVPIWAFYLLRDRAGLTARFNESLPPEWRADVWAVLGIIERVVGRWIRAQIVLGLIIGVATYAGLLLLSAFVDPRFGQFAVLLAVIAGLLELLPIIGPILAMVPTLLLALTTADPVASLVAVLVLYVGIQQVENAVLVPKIQGDAVELHPSVVIFVLIVGAAIAGLSGAILAVPITAAARGVYGYLFRRASGEPPPAAAPGVRIGPPARTTPPATDNDAPPPEPRPTSPTGDRRRGRGRARRTSEGTAGRGI
ncbi:MAG: AI-2E family transporter [Chloroflexota bacterium]|nr:AI-2E family transporter [Chloroflexota bacterium]